MEKTKEAVKRQLKEQWDKACNGYLLELLRMWELDSYYGFWVTDEVGGVYDYGDGTLTVGMDVIIYCVENDVTREQYEEWQEYVCEATEFHLPTPNLRSWMRGCPRTPKETIEKLRRLKADLDNAVEDAKKGGMQSCW